MLKTIMFTPLEWGFISERLHLTSAILEVYESELYDVYGDNDVKSKLWLERCEDELHRLQALDGTKHVTIKMYGVTRWIIEDCIVGSTYLSGIREAYDLGDETVSRGMIGDTLRIVANLENKTGVRPYNEW